ncbi:hypothetical protein SAMN05444156_3235 [Verrucomicrobium sp. GAS474]|nr:hypothetical protein SAMN05444156_3235 [Verrucomicrobium sp. GAS474]
MSYASSGLKPIARHASYLIGLYIPYSVKTSSFSQS